MKRVFILWVLLLTAAAAFAQTTSGLPAPSVSSPNDGVHATGEFLYCNTTEPSILSTITNAQGWGGSTGSGTCTTYLLNVPSSPPTANQTMMFPAPTSNASQAAFVNFWHLAAAPVNLTAQAANVSTTTLLTTPAVAGFYRLCMTSSTTRAATTSSTSPNLNAAFTDANDSIVKFPNIYFGSANTANSTVFSGGGCLIFKAAASSAIQYGTSGYVSSGATTMQFDLTVTLETE